MRNFKLLLILVLILGVAAVPVFAGARAQYGSGIYDYAEVLTGDDMDELKTFLHDFEEQQQMSIAVLFIDELNGETPQNYADDFYDYNEMGVGDSKDGLLLLVSFAERDVYISTCGEAINLFSDDGLDTMVEEISFDLAAEDYSAAVLRFVMLAEKNSVEAREEIALSETIHMRYSVWQRLLFALLIGLLAGGITVGIMVLVHKQSEAKAPGAQNYNESFNLIRETDRYVRTNTTRVKIQQNNNSGGDGGGHSGGSSHKSSSGTSHGGRGGKF